LRKCYTLKFQADKLLILLNIFSMSVLSGSSVRWRRLTKSTVELAMSRPYQSLSVAELARQTGVPERTLRAAFQGSYGLSPQEHLRLQRLHQARRLLRTSGQDQTTVTQIAFGLGFWDLGRFASAYGSLYGERPSETLRKPAPKGQVSAR
jgi:transcriptional regulator GlxA family with amidase domain